MSNRARRKGSVLVYTLVSMVVFIGLCLLSVDLGRAQLAKTELRRLTDAAARYAVKGASDNTAYAKASWVAGQNAVDNAVLTLAPADVEVGSWNADTRTFTPGGKPKLAARVTARRTIPTVFGASVGATHASLTVRSVAKIQVIGYGLIGLNSITMSGNPTASYASKGGGVTDQGNIASNGNITLNGNSTVNGNTYTGPGKTVNGGTVTGTKNTLTSPLSFPNGSASPYGPTNNDNGNIPDWALSNSNALSVGNQQSLTLPGGHYFLSSFNVTAGGSITFTGPATIYCFTQFMMSGHATTSGSLPGNLTIVMVPNPQNGNPPGSVTVGSSSSLHANIYAPQSAVNLSGSGNIYGSVLGLTVSMTGSSAIYYDLSLHPSNGKIMLVE